MEVIRIREKKLGNLKVKSGFIAIGDVHLFNDYPYNSSASIISDRLIDIATVLDLALGAGAEFKLPVFINGDLLLQKTLDYAVLSTLAITFELYKDVRVVINLGNHDLEGKSSVLSPLFRFAGNENHKIISAPSIIDMNDFNAVVIPYDNETQNRIQILNLKKDLKNQNKKNILFVHNIFRNSKFGKRKAKSGLSQKLFTKGKMKDIFSLIVASDIHKYQEICNGLGFYTSSPIPLNFGERSIDHGFHIIDLNKDKRYFVIPKAPKFIYMDFDNINEDKVPGNIVKITFTDKSQKTNERETHKKLMELGARHVSFKNETFNTITDDEEDMIINEEDVTTEAIVSNFSRILAREKELKRKKVERVGMKILTDAKSMK